MKILVTAGATMAMIDKVRAITNIFKGRTGTEIARYAYEERGHQVRLLTSNPQMVDVVYRATDNLGFSVQGYKTYDELAELMEREIRNGGYDAIIHSAAVSDYKVEGTYQYTWNYDPPFDLVDSSKKISSTEKELYLKLVPTEKLIDKIREPWGFKGKLVKFKLQVGIDDKELLDIATMSMTHSNADFIVANCLEWSKERAFIVHHENVDVKSDAGPEASVVGKTSRYAVTNVVRNSLASKLLDMLEGNK